MTTTDPPSQKPYLTITPPQGWAPIDFRELWVYRDMVWRMILRDIKSRYKQSALGPTWVIIIPLFQAGLFSVIFGTLAGLPTGGVPAFVFTYVGMLVWQQFNRAFTQTAGCIASNENLITKVYFPRLIAPISAVCGSVLDLFFGIIILTIMLVATGIAPPIQVLLAPLYIILAMIVAMGVGIWIACFSVKFRDLRYASSFLTQFIMWLTPVVYSSEIVLESDRLPETIRPTVEVLYQINPLFVAVEGFRWTIWGHAPGEPTIHTAVGVALAIVILFAGLLYFRRVDSTVADVI